MAAVRKDRERSKEIVRRRDVRNCDVSLQTRGSLNRPYNDFLADLDLEGTSERSKAIRFALAMSPDIRFQQFLERMDERRPTTTLAAVAIFHRISLPEFVQFWKDARHQYAELIAFDQFPEKVRDLVMRSAAYKEGVCAHCNGYGWEEISPDMDPNDVPGYRLLQNNKPARDCPACGGDGIARRQPDTTARAALMEMNGYGKKSGVKIVQNFGASLDQTMAKMPAMTLDVEAEEAES